MDKILSKIYDCVRSKLITTYNIVKIKQNRKNLYKFQNLYNGKRCFIIGNGPSLNVSDLEKIRNEISFASNRIYKIFSSTDWRPTFYTIQDYKCICESWNSISKIDASEKFIGIVPYYKYDYNVGFHYIALFLDNFYPDLPKFSDDIKYGIFEGYTVTYMNLQLAVYMGFKEIYLLGVDHNYSVELNPDGTIKHNEGVKDHFNTTDTLSNLPALYKSTLAYMAAKNYAKEHGIKIYNATRGGKLEVFDRIVFDEVFVK